MPASGEDIYTGIYEIDLERRNQLGGMAQQVAEALSGLDMHDEHIKAMQLEDLIRQDTFKVLVLGEFKTGKSTFINALLGEAVLPSYAVPTTAIINEIKWGEKRQALLHFRDEEKAPLDIPVDQLEDYVVIKSSEEEVASSPYSHVELFWNLDLCHHHVEIIDSPGLNESEVREKVTVDYLRKVDAILFVMTALRVGPSLSEKETLALLEATGHKELFFIINQYDLLAARDRDRVRERALHLLSQYTERQRDEAIHFISSLQALEGRLQGDQQLFAQSNLEPLEKVLHQFLATERSRVKVARGGNELRLMISKSFTTIPAKQALLQTPLAQLEQRYRAADRHFTQLQIEKQDMIRRVQGFRTDMRELIRGRVREFFLSLEGKIDGWVQDYSLQPKMSLNIKGQVNDAVHAMAASLNQHVGEEFKTWEKDILTSFLDDRLQSMQRELEQRANDFEAQLQRTRFELLQAELSPLDVNTRDMGPKNAFERVLAAAGGWVVAGPAGAGLGAVFGLRQVANAIIPQVLAVMAAIIIGLPVLPVMIVAGLLHGGVATVNLIKHVKEEIAKVYKQKLRELSPIQGDKIAHQFDQELGKLETRLEEGLQVRINEVREQIEATLQEKRRGEDAVAQKMTAIKEIESRLREVDAQLFSFITDLAVGRQQ